MMIHPPPHAAVERFLSFINASPTPFHAVANSIKKLEAVGFSRLKERDDWVGSVKKGGKYYVTRVLSVRALSPKNLLVSYLTPNGLLKVAFAVGGAYKPGNGIGIVGCHTDSCCFKVRPISKKSKLGYLQVGVETYGGGIFPSWLDRDLGLAGRVVVRSPPSAASSTPTFSTHLVHIAQPLLRIPTLAIHLERTQGDSLKYNTETQMVPILALASDTLNAEASEKEDKEVKKTALDTSANHHPLLLSILAGALEGQVGRKIAPDEIHDLELSLFDIQPSVVGGAKGEFIFSARLDNLFSSFAAVEGLCESVESTTASLEQSADVRMIALWDNEEIGSVSFQGAESNFLQAMLTRVADAVVETSSPSLLERTLAASFLLSCDMGHAVHPSFPEKHEENHRPLMNKGPAIKTNAKQRYASTAATTFILRRIAALADVPMQEYEVRNDMACGSTIGPLVSQIGLRTVDIGCAQLSMHSIREQAGCQDLVSLIKLFETFFEKLEEVDGKSFSTGE